MAVFARKRFVQILTLVVTECQCGMINPVLDRKLHMMNQSKTTLVVAFVLTWIVSVAMPGTNEAYSQGEVLGLRAATVSIPPYAFENDDGMVTGFVVDLFDAIAKNAQLDYRIEILPWLRAMKYVELGELDILPVCALRPDRKTDFVFSEPYAKGTIVIATSSQADHKRFNSIADLVPISSDVGTLGAGALETVLEAHKIKGYDRVFNYNAAIAMLRAKRVRAFVGWKLAMNQQLAKNENIGGGKIYLRETISLVFGSCISKKHPEALLIQKKLNQSLNELKTDGTLDGLLEAYLRGKKPGS